VHVNFSSAKVADLLGQAYGLVKGVCFYTPKSIIKFITFFKDLKNLPKIQKRTFFAFLHIPKVLNNIGKIFLKKLQ